MFQQIIDNLTDRFEDHAIFLEVNNKWYNELYNVEYQLGSLTIKDLLPQNIEPNHKDDQVERNNILSFFKDKIDLLKKDKYTRQVVYTPMYQGNNNLNACLSLFQLIIRKNVLDIHVFVRSQHFDNNFKYDNQTYSLLMTQMSKALKIDMGKVYVKIISLHK